MKADRTTIAPEKEINSKRAALALFAFIFFARAWLIKVWGSPVPFLDQWDAEALGLFRPWLDGTLRWSDLFAPHNEHRIVLTRLADLALFIVDGNWNPWWQLLLNATLHAATATILLSLFWKETPRHFRPLWLLGLALLFIALAGWQNALWGFQSQVYFCSLLSVLALAGLLLGQPFKRNWWLGWTAALLALFTVGSGLLAAATALLISAHVLITTLIAQRSSHSPKREQERRTITPITFTLFAIFALVVAGWALRVEAPHHATLRAHSVTQFSAVFFRCLSWPWVDSDWLWLVLQAPLLWFTAKIIWRRSPPQTVEKFILGLGLLAMLHAAAVAYSRGAGLLDARPLSRYQDPLLLGVAANFFLLLKFAAQHRTGRIAALCWTGIFLAGLLTLTTTNLSLHLPYKRMQDAASFTQIRAYLTTHDPAVFHQQQVLPFVHPNTTVVQRILDDPQLQPRLPREFSDAAIRPPWLIEFSPWFTLLSGIGLLLTAINYSRTAKT